MGKWWFYGIWWDLPSGDVKIAIENGHRNSEFSQETWWFSMAMLNYQRVYGGYPFLGYPYSWMVHDRNPTSMDDLAWCSLHATGFFGDFLAMSGDEKRDPQVQLSHLSCLKWFVSNESKIKSPSLQELRSTQGLCSLAHLASMSAGGEQVPAPRACGLAGK